MDRQKVTVDDVTEAVKEHAEPVVATSSIADVLDVSDPTARKWLKRARDAGRIGQKQLPSGVRVWFPPSAGQSMLGQFADDVPDPEPEEEPEVSTDGGELATQAGVEQEVAGVEQEVADLRELFLEQLAEVEREVKNLDPADEGDDSPEGPYADVDSSARRYWLKERDTWQRGITPLGTAAAGMLIIAVLVAVPRLPAIPGLGVEPFVVAMWLAFALAGGAGLATVTAGVITLLLRLRVFTKAGRALPFRPDPDAEGGHR